MKDNVILVYWIKGSRNEKRFISEEEAIAYLEDVNCIASRWLLCDKQHKPVKGMTK
jgi:hypothetical protein